MAPGCVNQPWLGHWAMLCVQAILSVQRTKLQIICPQMFLSMWAKQAGSLVWVIGKLLMDSQNFSGGAFHSATILFLQPAGLGSKFLVVLHPNQPYCTRNFLSSFARCCIHVYNTCAASSTLHYLM